MDRPALLAPFHPVLLPLDTVIGGWRVEAWTGCGVFGAVYRAVPARDPYASPVALKLAVRPADPRFAREAELLSRCHHPSIPRLLDQGSWLSPAATHHPFLVMQWIDGVSLYEQDRLHAASSAQLRRWLLQLSQALAVVHGQGAVHRDLNGRQHLSGGLTRGLRRARRRERRGQGRSPGAD
ncbi:MAG: protein kinase domain-containing protein [Hyalangium sp.]|uniref:protein kinase domain-containing protein n=1 Tax=Hyalangium sp. TaxID=2028555 RepID=UPI00389A6E17